MRTDQPPFNDVRVRRAISYALDRQGLIEAVYVRANRPRRWPVVWSVVAARRSARGGCRVLSA